MAFCGALWVPESVAEGAPKTNQCVVEWVGGVVQDGMYFGQHRPL